MYMYILYYKDKTQIKIAIMRCSLDWLRSRLPARDECKCGEHARAHSHAHTQHSHTYAGIARVL